VLEAVSQSPEALKYAHESLKQDHDLLRVCGYEEEKPTDDRRLICISKKFSLHDTASDFSARMVRSLLLNPYWRSNNLRPYNPDGFNKGFCCEKPGNAGDVDWDRVTELDYPCRGALQGPGECTRKVCLKDGRPTTGSCWRYSYKWHLELAQNSGFMLQIVELQDGVLKLGDGQKIEQSMALELGVNILRIQEPHSDVDFNELGENLANKHKQKSWDTPFQEGSP